MHQDDETRRASYAALASLNCDAVELRQQISVAKTEIAAIERDGLELDMMVDRLHALEKTLRVVVFRRRLLLRVLSAYPLPPRTLLELQSMEHAR